MLIEPERQIEEGGLRKGPGREGVVMRKCMDDATKGKVDRSLSGSIWIGALLDKPLA